MPVDIDRDTDMWLVKTDEDLLFDTSDSEMVLDTFFTLVRNSSTKFLLEMRNKSEIRIFFDPCDEKGNNTLVSPSSVPIRPQELILYVCKKAPMGCYTLDH